jgi:cytochrome c oxidase cbb3-type subunit 4
MTTYAIFAHIAQTWGLALFVVLFAFVLIYALKPSNRDRFERASRTPLEED